MAVCNLDVRRVDWEKVADLGARLFAVTCVGITAWATWLMLTR